MIAIYSIEHLAQAIYRSNGNHDWPQRWGWTEMPEAKKKAYRERAQRVVVDCQHQAKQEMKK